MNTSDNKNGTNWLQFSYTHIKGICTHTHIKYLNTVILHFPIASILFFNGAKTDSLELPLLLPLQPPIPDPQAHCQWLLESAISLPLMLCVTTK